MAQQPNWRTSLPSTTRYDNIHNLKAAIQARCPSSLAAQKEAFALENAAYQSSSSLDEYQAACNVLPASAPATPTDWSGDHAPASPGITIGSHHDCHHIAAGLTAEVYRAQSRALKVITETRKMEPHNPVREAQILSMLRRPCVPLLETFRDQEQRLVLVFPYMPLSLEALLGRGAIGRAQLLAIFADLFTALSDIHGDGIVHRDIKPSALLLQSPTGPAYLSDFGTAWHPDLSAADEPADAKVLDIGTGPYRAPEVLFGDRCYGTAVDMWAAGAMLAECLRDPPQPLFESRPTYEDGNQLGLILSIFKTIGSPTRESWPEAALYRTPPFDMYQYFAGRRWEQLLPKAEPQLRRLVADLVRYDGQRATASQALHVMASLA